MKPSATGARALLAGIAALTLLVGADVVLDESSAALVGSYVIAPFVAALLGGPVVTLFVGVLASVAAATSGAWNMNTGTEAYVVRLVVIAAGTAFGVISARNRSRSRARAGRLTLLDAVGEVADGSLPLAETLRRVIDVLVPAVGDICMVDAIHEGRASRLAARARGREDAERVERGIMARQPSLPDWLLRADPEWRLIPRWLPKMGEEDLRRMAQSPQDLEFLLSLGVCSSLTVPIAARDRNLGALTLVAAWSGRRYTADDLQFAQILASRIALALDNAGLFSDLVSVERRMDTVMSILDEAVLIHDAEGELVFANPAAARTLGFTSSEEAVSASAERLAKRFTIRDESGREMGVEALTGRRVLEGEPSELTLRVTERGTHEERWYLTRVRPIEGPDGGLMYSVTAIEDVTDVKRAEFSQRLFASTGELLSDSTDYVRMLDRVAHLLVPEFADWCGVSVPRDDGLIEQVAVAHQDPQRVQFARELREQYPSRIEDTAGAAEVIRTGEPQLLAEIDDATLADAAQDAEHLRLLRSVGLASAIVAPMVGAGGRIVGALSFANETGSRTFDETDLETAVEVARRAGLAIESARLTRERERVTEALQRELLPTDPPAIPGWEIATMYEPAGEVNEVGGDFYEVFRAGDGWGVVLGDVSGHGPAAASLTAEARHTLRAAGQLSKDPSDGLRLLDGNLRGREDAALCSVVMVVLEGSTAEDEDESDARVYLAGHPPPLLLRDGKVDEVGEAGPLLGGVSDRPTWPPAPVALRLGDQLVLYTDGVIEARRGRGQRFGTDRLRESLAGCTRPEAAVARVREELSDFLSRSPEDDAALVVLRRTGPDERQAPEEEETVTASAGSAG